MRVICWFSHGAASAVALKLASDSREVIPVYCDTSADEHPDNARFRRDVERWTGLTVTVIRSDKFTDVDQVFVATRFMAGPRGARCSAEMKKLPRFAFQLPDDLHVFGYTADPRELNRITQFEQRNPELQLWWVLREHNLRKSDCHRILREAGIQSPEMYRLGFRNNNCIGCVKATSPAYWNRVRRHYPDRFELRARRSRELGVRLVEIHKGERIFLDELPIDLQLELGEDTSCGPACGS